ncbi:MAG: DegV family protein [Butyricicoccus sp.]|nr:DegV family protein [Butyricicoccus sp.]MBQ8585655.1 DegV family protein [Butyricicoccus sp.]
MSVRIVIDSTADVSVNVKDRMTVVPLTLHFGEEEYLDGVTIDHKTFYEKLVESDVLPTTSQATPAAFAEVFEEAKQAGDSVVVVTIASKLSGTYQSAVIAASDYENVYVVDSCTAAIGSGILAKYGLWLADEGLEAKEIAERLSEVREKICVIAMLDTLEYLKRGGRISKTVAFAGGLLNIKPVVEIRDGEINMLGKARGSKQGNNLLVKEIEEAGGVDFTKPVMLGYTGLSDDLLRKYVEDSKHLWENDREKLHSTCIGSVIGTHAGPGAVAVAFFKKG